MRQRCWLATWRCEQPSTSTCIGTPPETSRKESYAWQPTPTLVTGFASRSDLGKRSGTVLLACACRSLHTSVKRVGQIHVDLVGSDVTMTGTPEDVPALARVVIPDVTQHGYRAYPLVDHIADKVAAIVERHGPNGWPSTRYKDLVDLVAIVSAASIGAEPQMKALSSEASRRGIVLPSPFVVPDREMWGRGYAAEAKRSLLPVARTLDDALALVRPFLNPLLDGTAVGSWAPQIGQWTAS